jgi:hypothetical protein
MSPNTEQLEALEMDRLDCVAVLPRKNHQETGSIIMTTEQAAKIIRLLHSIDLETGVVIAVLFFVLAAILWRRD